MSLYMSYIYRERECKLLSRVMYVCERTAKQDIQNLFKSTDSVLEP